MTPLLLLAGRRVVRDAAQLLWLSVLTGLAGAGLVVTLAIGAGGSDEDIGGAGVLAVVIGAVVVTMAFGLVWATRLRDVAQLRALGASRGQVRRILVGEAVLIGVVGAVLCVPFGRVAGELASQARDVPVVFETSDAVLAAVLACGGCLVAGLTASRKAARVAPISLLRSSMSGPRRAWVRVAIAVVTCGLLVQQVIAKVNDPYLENATVLLVLGVVALAAAAPLATALAAGTVAWVLRTVRPSSGLSRVMSLARVEPTRDLASGAVSSVPSGIAAMLLAFPILVTAAIPEDVRTTVSFNPNMFAVLVMIAVIVLVGLVFSAALSIRQRRPVLGMLRAVGATRGDLVVVISLQTLLGTAVGVGLGVVLGIVVAWSANGSDIQTVVPYGQLTLLVVTMVAAATIAVGLLARLQLASDPLFTLAAARAE